MERWTQPAAVRQLVWPPCGGFFLFHMNPQFISEFISHLKSPNYSDLYFFFHKCDFNSQNSDVSVGIHFFIRIFHYFIRNVCNEEKHSGKILEKK